MLEATRRNLIRTVSVRSRNNENIRERCKTWLGVRVSKDEI